MSTNPVGRKAAAQDRYNPCEDPALSLRSPQDLYMDITPNAAVTLDDLGVLMAEERRVAAALIAV